jgi:hypothetical protein
MFQEGRWGFSIIRFSRLTFLSFANTNGLREDYRSNDGHVEHLFSYEKARFLRGSGQYELICYA